MVCTLASGWFPANSHKPGEASVVVRVWVWSHMPIHNLRRHSNTLCMYDMDEGYSWKVLQPQSTCSCMVCTLESGWIPANTHKSGEASVMVMVWVWSHMPIHNLRRHSNTIICMTWTWDAVWKVLQPQSTCSGMVCTLVSGRILPNSHKSGEVSVVVMMWMWNNTPIHNLRRHSNTSYMYGMDMGCSLQVSTDTTKA